MVKKVNPSAIFRIGGERSRTINYGKIILVIFITILIWVWTDLALDEEFSVSSAVISVAKSTNPALWVSFDDESSVSIERVVLKGPASRIADVRRQLNDGSLAFEFFLDPEREAMVDSGEHNLNVLNFLKKSDKIKLLGLTVESSEQETLSVDVVELVKKPLDVRCIDEDQNPIKDATIKPAQVDMFVPRDWAGEKLVAQVQLTRPEIDQARVAAVRKVPYIKLTAGQTRKAPIAVRITTPQEEDTLSDYTITTATLGFSLSANLQGKYKVEVTNSDAVMSAITIRATTEAKRAYENMRYQVILEIDDDDAKSTEPLRKELIYNFPAECVRRDEIVLNQRPVIARFNLLPLSTEAQPSPAH